MVGAGIEERYVLDAEDLPLLRQQLELKLKALELAEQTSVAARRKTEAHLQDVGVVEQKLRERTKS